MAKKLIVALLLAGIVASFFVFDLFQYIDPAFFESRRDAIQKYQADHALLVAGLYFLIYVIVTALSLPGAAVMTLVGGALFGLWTGLVLVSFASTIGATLAFLIARFLLQDWVQQKFGRYLEPVNDGVRKDGALYLFTLRLVPLFPFFVINLVMALTPIRAVTFYWVSQVGMLAGTFVYVNAGTELASIETVGGLLSPGLIGAFVLLGIFPWIARAIVNLVKARRLYSRYTKPKTFDNNLIVIGGGAAGLVSAYIAAMVKARVTLIEGHRMGGDCLNTGCVPSKALIRSARVGHLLSEGETYGLKNVTGQVDFPAVMKRVQEIIDQVEPHDSVERYSGLGVNCITGTARIISPWEVEVNGDRLTTRNIIIAAGAKPFVPPITGIDDTGYLTSDTLWSLKDAPKRLLILGGGPIGCELAQAFRRLGSEVTIVEAAPRIMPHEDEEAARLVSEVFAKEGVVLLTGHEVTSFRSGGAGQVAVLAKDGQERQVTFDTLLVATGRKANVAGLGAEHLGLEVTRQGTLEVDKYMRTKYPNIFACGDVVGPYQFTHMAAHQAWYAAVNALFGTFRKFAVDYRIVPRATFTDPEVASVGLGEEEATKLGISCEVTRYGLDDLDRAIADSANHGFVKVLTPPGNDRILGVTIVGAHASELIAEFILAMKHGLGLNKILGTIHIYPTLNEANKYVAGEWKKKHKPERLLKWVEKYHNWRRG
ncbi:FAD-dependent oxidoreductase [Emcibacter sp.]|uniref:FAD-dependent oxidoreductase n=1 Tax=Emcibacter sp. TaxID=1979954 RepID=UPI002AA85A27|nr:FAD-dependent oxidoreductase [Emcibacter sp.]